MGPPAVASEPAGTAQRGHCTLSHLLSGPSPGTLDGALPAQLRGPCPPRCACLVSLERQHSLFPPGLACPAPSPSSPGGKDSHAPQTTGLTGRQSVHSEARGRAALPRGVTDRVWVWPWKGLEDIKQVSLCCHRSPSCHPPHTTTTTTTWPHLCQPFLPGEIPCVTQPSLQACTTQPALPQAREAPQECPAWPLPPLYFLSVLWASFLPSQASVAPQAERARGLSVGVGVPVNCPSSPSGLKQQTTSTEPSSIPKDQTDRSWVLSVPTFLCLRNGGSESLSNLLE